MSPRQRWTDDRALVRACLDGDGDAWEALILRYRRLIYSVAVAHRMPGPMADDVFQRVALKLLEHLARIREPGKLPSWLVVTTRRECRAALRSGRRFQELGDGPDDEPSADPPDVVQAIHDVAREHALALALERIGEPCGALLTALYVEDPTPSYAEIAERLGRPIGSLGPTRSRCLEKLRRLYLASGGETP